MGESKKSAVEKKSIESTSAPQASPMPSQKVSPFLSAEAPVVAEEAPAESEPVPSLAPVWNPPVIPELKPLFDKKTPLLTANSQKWPWRWIGAGVLVCALGMVLVGWYFLRNGTNTKENAVVPVVETPSSEVKVMPTAELPYSLDTPNYLSLDTETVTPESFREVLQQAGERMMAAHMAAPVEFLLTDKNNNPLAFTRFAYLMKLDLDADFLATLGETFSFYIYPANGTLTFGFGLSFVGTPGSDPFHTQKEASLPSAFRSILYHGMTVQKNTTFRSGSYNGQSVRYVNIDGTQNASFDYAIIERRWFIGASKDMLRALLDKK